jgi:DNA mismatch repair protein MutS2
MPCELRSVSGWTRRSSPTLAGASRLSACGQVSSSPRRNGPSARPRAREAEVERELERLRASADRVRSEAIAGAERELADARGELRGLRQELRAVRRSRREQDQDRLLGAATDRVRRAERALGDLSGPLGSTRELAAGDPVEAPDIGVRGTIAAIRGDEAEVVGAAGQRLRIPLARLRPSRERAPEERAPSVQVRATARSDVSDQLDVRGLPAHEAREQVRRVVDEAALAGLTELRVVHGRGTGALRKAVRDELTSHPLVDRYAADADDGATVATLG